MSIGRAPIVYFGLIVLAAQVMGTKKVTIDAALRFMSNYLMLFAGEDSMIVEEYKEYDLGKKTDMEVPEEMQVQAAFSTGPSMNLYYYGPQYGHRVNLKERKGKKLRYGPHRKFLQNGGPDAAARKSNKVYLFRGCDMVIRFKWNKWGKSQNVTDIGLPCNPDAAWNIEDGNTVVVLKGDQIWLWGTDPVADGPKNFTSMYNITSWELIPSNEK